MILSLLPCLGEHFASAMRGSHHRNVIELSVKQDPAIMLTFPVSACSAH